MQCVGSIEVGRAREALIGADREGFDEDQIQLMRPNLSTVGRRSAAGE